MAFSVLASRLDGKELISEGKLNREFASLSNWLVRTITRLKLDTVTVC